MRSIGQIFSRKSTGFEPKACDLPGRKKITDYFNRFLSANKWKLANPKTGKSENHELSVTKADIRVFDYIAIQKLNGKSGKAVVSQEKIAAALDICRATVNRALNKLCAFGVLKSFARFRKEENTDRNGRLSRWRLANSYYFTRNLMFRLYEAIREGRKFLLPEPEKKPENPQFITKKDEHGRAYSVRVFDFSAHYPAPQPETEGGFSDDTLFKRYLIAGADEVESLMRSFGAPACEIRNKIQNFSDYRNNNLLACLEIGKKYKKELADRVKNVF
jgi:hypothetical protein